MTFGTNSSPMVGRDGKIVTARKIEERLNRETQRDVSLKVEPATNESFLVSGRGELHLGILIENMRREGFEIEEAEAGDIVAIAGLADISVGETVCDNNNILPLPTLHIDEPTLQMTFGTNSSPMVGRDGKIVTARKIEERLMRETQRDVSLRVEAVSNDSYLVSGRG